MKQVVAFVRFVLFAIVCLVAIAFAYWLFLGGMIWLVRSKGFGVWFVFTFLGASTVVLLVCGIMGWLLSLIMLISRNVFSFVFALICIVGWGGYYTYVAWMSDPSFFPYQYQFIIYIFSNILLAVALYSGASNAIINEN